MRPSRQTLIWIIRIAVSAVVLAVIFHIVPFAQVMDAIQRLPLWVWGAGFALFLIGHALTAAKWWMLIGADMPFGRAFRAHLAGLGANLALPGVAGGDVVRAALVLPVTKDKGRLAMGSLADRLIDTVSLALVALVGAWFAFATALESALEIMAVLIGISIAAIVAVRFLGPPLGAWALKRAGEGKVGKLLARVGELLVDFARRPGLLLACLVLSIAVQCLFVGINIAFASALGMTLSDAAWFYAWAAAKIIAILPISLGGLGVREASMAALLQPFGADYGAVIAVGLIWQTVLYASGLLGILIQSGLSVLPGRAKPSANDTPSQTRQI